MFSPQPISKIPPKLPVFPEPSGGLPTGSRNDGKHGRFTPVIVVASSPFGSPKAFEIHHVPLFAGNAGIFPNVASLRPNFPKHIPVTDINGPYVTAGYALLAGNNLGLSSYPAGIERQVHTLIGQKYQHIRSAENANLNIFPTQDRFPVFFRGHPK